MIVLSNTTTQTIQPNAIALFNTDVMHTGCAEDHRDNTGTINLNANCNCRTHPIYELFFNGNVGGAAGSQANLVIVADGITNLPETTMTATIALATDVQNVAAHTFFRKSCNSGNTVAIKNVGTTPVTLAANPSFAVRRVN